MFTFNFYNSFLLPLVLYVDRSFARRRFRLQCKQPRTPESKSSLWYSETIWCKPTHILACKFICVNLKCRISKFLKFKIFNELDRFFSSFQVPVNESARQVCRSLTCTARSVSFGRVRLRSETYERARPLAGCSQAKGVAWKTTRYTRNAGLLQTV